MEDLKKRMEVQLENLDDLITKTEFMLEQLKNVPDKKFQVSRSNGSHQYMWVNSQTKERSYAGKEDRNLLKQVAQRDYLNSMDLKLRSLRLKLWRFINQYDINDLIEVYEKLPEGRKRLVKPLFESTDEFVDRWLGEEYEPMSFEDENEFFSNGGVRVRSKSEIIIANALEKYNVPYKYEKAIMLRGTGKVRPDFSALNVEQRKEIIWEHFGMMDNVAYANKNVAKIMQYQHNGFFIGDNLIVTFESSANPLSTKMVDEIVTKYFL